MKHILVPVLSDADLKAIPDLVNYLSGVQPVSVVVVSNPSVGLTSESATKDIDARIVSLEAAKKEASDREDFAAAQNYKEQIEAAKMDKSSVARSGWKNASKEDLEKASALIVKPFEDAFGKTETLVQQIVLTEDCLEDGFFNTLSNLAKHLPPSLPAGQFAVAPPRSVDGTARKPSEYQSKVETPLSIPKPVAAVTEPKKQASPELPSRDKRDQSLRQQYFTLKKAAKEHGIDFGKFSREEIREMVLAREFPKAA